jgi:hypothetical protein
MPEEVKPCLGHVIQYWIVGPYLRRKMSIDELECTSSNIGTRNQCVVQISKEQHCVGDHKNCANLSPADVVSCRAQNVTEEPLQYDERLGNKVAALSLEMGEEKHRRKASNEVEQVKSKCSYHKSYE